MTVTPTPPPSYKQEPKPYYKPELPPLNEVRTAVGNSKDNNNNSSNINSNKTESAKTGDIKEDAEKEPVIQAILDIFDGEILNHR